MDPALLSALRRTRRIEEIRPREATLSGPVADAVVRDIRHRDGHEELSDRYTVPIRQDQLADWYEEAGFTPRGV